MKKFTILLVLVSGSLFTQGVFAQDVCGVEGHPACPRPDTTTLPASTTSSPSTSTHTSTATNTSTDYYR